MEIKQCTRKGANYNMYCVINHLITSLIIHVSDVHRRLTYRSDNAQVTSLAY